MVEQTFQKNIYVHTDYFMKTSISIFFKSHIMPASSKQTTTTIPTPNGGTTPGTPTTPVPSTSTVEIKVEEEKLAPDFLDSLSKSEEKSKIGFPSSQMNNLNVGDYRTLVKTLVCGVKTITWGCASCKVSNVKICFFRGI